ncbi:BIG/ATPase V1 complex, subunit S1 [Phyllosticta capitalensis]|uniref:BIG/ATPase V1 complex, subunit S1 n=1 Tax=Phyllosticta capitalensis TaxID=121624 RepID=UPI00312F02C5
MALRTVGAVALSISAAAAFQGASPLFVVSSSSELPQFESKSLVTSSSASQSVEKLISGCPSDSYIVVNQPGVSVADYDNKWSAPWLRKRFQSNDKHITTATINEVIDGLDAENVSKYVAEHCNAARAEVDASSGYISLEDTTPRVIKVDFSAPPVKSEDRASALLESDAFLDAVMAKVQDKSYTLIFTTTPPTGGQIPVPKEHEVQYEMEDSYGLHTEMRRETRTRPKASNDVALFEKYQFLSPGIFMGLFTGLILFLILYVGISAVAGLEVSYYAFSKEMGPAAQKKQQ